MAESHWWLHHKLVNGVFKGGGAKGAVYAGALEALDEEKLWFGAVAGASAGAITASLVAAGERPTDLRLAVPELMGSVQLRLWRTAMGLSDALYDSRELSRQLEDRYRRALGVAGDRVEPVTFAELEDHTGMPLYVVALDLALQRPVVFSPYTTPDVSVAASVLASAAIPGAFPSGRALWRSTEAPIVHRLVDGGAWANYPRFVFEDESFLGWLENAVGVSLERQRRRPTVGFALGDVLSPAPPSPAAVLRHDSGPTEWDKGTALTAPNPAVWSLGLALSGRTVRLLLGLSMILATFAMWFIGIPELLRDLWGWVDSDRTGVLPLLLFVVSLLVILAATSITVASAALVLFGKPLGDVLVPSARAALAVGTQLPPWLGHAEDDHVVLLPVGGLTTRGFAPGVAAVNDGIAEAKKTTLAYIAGHPSIAERAEVEEWTGPVTRNEISNPANATPSREGLEDPLGIYYVILALFGGDAATTWGLLIGNAFLVIVGLLALLGAGLLLTWTSSNYQARVASGARTNLMVGRQAIRFGVGAVVLGIAAVGVGVVQAAGREDDKRDERARVRILSARWLPEHQRRDEGGYRFQFEYAFKTLNTGSRVQIPDTGTFRERRRLQPTDEVLVQPNNAANGRLDLLDPAPDWFSKPLIISLLGLLGIWWGAGLLRIRQRDRVLERQAPTGPRRSSAV